MCNSIIHSVVSLKCPIWYTGLFTCIYMSRNMWFPTMWYVRLAKVQTSLHICADWSEPLLVAWIFYKCWATDRTSFGVSKLKWRLHRLVWVYTCQNATLLEITCHGSYINYFVRASYVTSYASSCFLSLKMTSDTIGMYMVSLQYVFYGESEVLSLWMAVFDI